MDYSRIARKLRERIAGFSGELSRGLPKVARRFTGEMLYGIQAGQSVVLDRGAKLRGMAGHVLKAAKRVFGIPDFHYYAIADELMSIFLRYPGKLFQALCAKPGQGLLFLSDG